jgi:hypothetical protein
MLENTVARCALPLLTGGHYIEPSNDFLGAYLTSDDCSLVIRDHEYQPRIREFLVASKVEVLRFFSEVYNLRYFVRHVHMLTSTCRKFYALIPWDAIYWNIYGAVASCREWYFFNYYHWVISSIQKPKHLCDMREFFARPCTPSSGGQRLFSHPTWARDVFLPKRGREARREQWRVWCRAYLRRALVLTFALRGGPAFKGERLVMEALMPDYPAIRKRLAEERAMLQRRDRRMRAKLKRKVAEKARQRLARRLRRESLSRDSAEFGRFRLPLIFHLKVRPAKRARTEHSDVGAKDSVV